MSDLYRGPSPLPKKKSSTCWPCSKRCVALCNPARERFFSMSRVCPASSSAIKITTSLVMLAVFITVYGKKWRAEFFWGKKDCKGGQLHTIRGERKCDNTCRKGAPTPALPQAKSAMGV